MSASVHLNNKVNMYILAINGTYILECKWGNIERKHFEQKKCASAMFSLAVCCFHCIELYF